MLPSPSYTHLYKPVYIVCNIYYLSLKAGFHMIADDRRRSQTIADRRSQISDDRKIELFPYNRRRSQTIAEPTVAIDFVQRKC